MQTCAACRSVWLADPPAHLEDYYPTGYYSFSDDPRGGGARNRRSRRVRDFAREKLGESMVRRVAPRLLDVDTILIGRFDAATAAVLDVGCGSGWALDPYREAGWSTFGVEPDESAADRARQRGHDVAAGDFMQYDSGGRDFTVVRMKHVVEHVPFPLAAVDRAVTMLRPGGTLFVEVPNLAGWSARVAGRYWSGLEPPRHLAIPHPRALRQHLARLPVEDIVLSPFTRGSAVAWTLWITAHHRLREPRWHMSDPPSRSLRLVGRLCEPLCLTMDLAGRGDYLRVIARRSA